MKPLTPEQRDEIFQFAKERSHATGRVYFYVSELERWLDENTRSFEPPTVIWNTSGGTGAQKGERK